MIEERHQIELERKLTADEIRRAPKAPEVISKLAETIKKNEEHLKWVRELRHWPKAMS